ncbi:DUF1203 domain-containing protein [Rhodobacterales bacterium HKCCE3408]|nr:DUF1203 domain-containing protein [Rhodobacterales bacterium HKCCE3408]
MQIRFEALPTDIVAHIRESGTDAYGNPVERAVSDGDGVPCRHCLKQVPEGSAYLVLAHRPFASVNAYTETGPIFLCADDCARAEDASDLPEILASPEYIVRGYSGAERIVYGTGQVTPTANIAGYAEALLRRPEIAFVDIRSAKNNCFQCRVRRTA